jgi:hypothetical protein
MKNRDILSLWIGGLNIVQMAILGKLIYRYTAIPMKNMVGFFYLE